MPHKYCECSTWDYEAFSEIPLCEACPKCGFVPTPYGGKIRPIDHSYITSNGVERCEWCKKTKLIINGGMAEFIESICKK